MISSNTILCFVILHPCSFSRWITISRCIWVLSYFCWLFSCFCCTDVCWLILNHALLITWNLWLSLQAAWNTAFAFLSNGSLCNVNSPHRRKIFHSFCPGQCLWRSEQLRISKQLIQRMFPYYTTAFLFFLGEASMYEASSWNDYYFALTTFFASTFKELLSLYGRNSKYRNPITSRNAATVPIPNAPVVINVPIW